MTRIEKLFMILLTIILFSSAVVNLVAVFFNNNPKYFLAIGIISLVMSYATNQEVIDEDEKNRDLNEYDEVF